MKDYYRIIEVHKDDGFYPNWKNLVGSILEADSMYPSNYRKGFMTICGHVIKPCPQENGYLSWEEGEFLYLIAVKLSKIHPSKRRKIDELRQHAA